MVLQSTTDLLSTTVAQPAAQAVTLPPSATDQAPLSLHSFQRLVQQLQADATLDKAFIELRQEPLLNVNALLFVIWLGLRHCRLKQQEVFAIQAAIEPWQQGVVQSLYGLLAKLTQLEQLCPTASVTLQACRASCERELTQAGLVEQDLLTTALGVDLLPRLSKPNKPCLKEICSNVSQYLKLRQLSMTTAMQRALSQLLLAVVANASGEEVQKSLQQAARQARLKSAKIKQLVLVGI